MCPFTLAAKLILQQLCKTKQSWDEDIPQTAVSKWTKWLGDLEKLKDFKVAQCVNPSSIAFWMQATMDTEIVSYLRVTAGQNTANVAFMVGKARVAPLMQTTIPRLELTAAVLAVRVDKI